MAFESTGTLVRAQPSVRVESIPQMPRDCHRPIFVVGCQRSGTTALAVMMDRHSRIAMLPETQFFPLFVPADRKKGGPMTREALVDRALADEFISQANLNAARVLHHFLEMPATYAGLFQAILATYAEKHGRPRAAEKSCDHLFHVDEILRVYPDARIICIYRDGRDVVRSLRSVPWGGPKPWMLYCRQWNMFAAKMLQMQRRLSPDQFTVVRYEDLIERPEKELRRLCAFVGEEFEPSQVEKGSKSDVVPGIEMAWKGKAMDAPDRGRVAAWRRSAPAEEIAKWNHYMGRWLRRLDYPDTSPAFVSPVRRLAWTLGYIPCLPGIHPIAIRINRVARWLIRPLRRKIRSRTPADRFSPGNCQLARS